MTLHNRALLDIYRALPSVGDSVANYGLPQQRENVLHPLHLPLLPEVGNELHAVNRPQFPAAAVDNVGRLRGDQRAAYNATMEAHVRLRTRGLAGCSLAERNEENGIDEGDLGGCTTRWLSLFDTG